MVKLKYPKDVHDEMFLAPQLRAEFATGLEAQMTAGILKAFQKVDVLRSDNPSNISMTLKNGIAPPTPKSVRRFLGILCEEIVGGGTGNRKVHRVYAETEAGLELWKSFYINRAANVGETRSMTSLFLGRTYYIIAVDFFGNGEVTRVRGVGVGRDQVEIDHKVVGSFTRKSVTSKTVPELGEAVVGPITEALSRALQ